MAAKIQMLCVGILLLVRIGVAQDCGLTHTLGSGPGGGFTPIDVNITDTPSCFVCPPTAVSYTLNGEPLTSDPPDVVIDGNTVSIFNWSAVLLNLPTVNMILCTDTVGFKSTTFFFSLTPGPLVLQQVEPFYLEGGNNTNVRCVNFNRRSGYSVTINNTEVWMNSAGEVVGSGRILNLTAIRDNAGNYTCTFPTVPLISPVMFVVVIYYAPEVSTDSLLPTTIDAWGILVLRCSYVGVPEAYVTWTLNDSVLNSTVDSGINTSTITTGSSMTTTLTWIHVPVIAQGTYYCVLVNAAGSGSGSYTIQIATTPEPAANFRVTFTTSTTMSLAWEKRFNGLLEILGAILRFFTGLFSSVEITVSGCNATLTNLTPFAFYNVTLFVTNRLGRSAPVSLVQQTDSNFLAAPTVTLTAVSSTELRLDWTAPAPSDLVETAANWTLEFSLPNGSDLQRETVVASTFTRLFQNISKGTEYRARVAGSNSRGMGAFSGYQTTETLVDPPSVPNNVVATPLSSFAVNVTWEVPTDMGGKPVTSYQVNLTGTASGELEYSETVNTKLFRFVNSMTFLEPSTMYQVSVAGINTAGLGESADQTVTTISLEQPQTVLVPVPVEMETNVSATVSWPFPGGNVTTYLLVLTERRSQISTNFSVNGTELSRVVVGLRPATTYDVVIITMNDLGRSMASPLSSFNTQPPPDPVITVNPLSGPYESDSDIALTCTSPDGSREIGWAKRDSLIVLEAPVFEIDGMFFESTLTIKAARESNTGTYVCTVGETNAERYIEVFTPTTTTPPPSSISSTTIIVAACVAGGGALILITLAIIIAVLCVCCRGGDRPKRRIKSGGYSPKKKGKDFFEISNTFTPTTNTGITRESNVSFNMPEEYNTHTSFNTMDKQNKVEISHSPDVKQPSSFGGNRGSTEGVMDYQMPPSDGTML